MTDMRWYPQDWRSDTAIRSCSFAARGLWMDMLCLMHNAEPRGYLMLAGRAMTTKELAKITNGRHSEVKKLLKELEGFGVFSRNGDGVIFSRMIRETKPSVVGWGRAS